MPAAPSSVLYRPLDASTVVLSWQPAAPPAAPVVGSNSGGRGEQATPIATMYELLYTQNKTLALPLWTKMTILAEENEAKVRPISTNFLQAIECIICIQLSK